MDPMVFLESPHPYTQISATFHRQDLEQTLLSIARHSRKNETERNETMPSYFHDVEIKRKKRSYDTEEK